MELYNHKAHIKLVINMVLKKGSIFLKLFEEKKITSQLLTPQLFYVQAFFQIYHYLNQLL